MKNKLEFSVIIPTFGRQKLLYRAVASVLEQNHPAREIIVVDDGSTPPISEEIKTLADNVRLIRFPTNRGVGFARNAGIRAAQAEYIALLDSDDTWNSRRLESAAAKLDQWRPEEPAIFFDNLVVNGRMLSHPPSVLDDPNILAEGLISAKFVVPTPSLIFHAKWRDTLEFDPTLRRLEDWDFLISAVANGFKLINLASNHVNVGKGAFRRRLSTERDTCSAIRFLQKNKAYLSQDSILRFEELNIQDPQQSRLRYISMVLRYLFRNQVSKGGALTRLLMASGLRRVSD